MTKAEVERHLDDLVPGIARKFVDQKSMPGWHRVSVNSPFAVGFTPIWCDAFPDGVEYVPTLTEDRARGLVALAKKDATAFDAAAYIAGVNTAASGLKEFPAIPESLRLFGAGVLMGIYRRPRQKGRSRIDDVPLRLRQYLLCRLVQTGAVVHLSRNRESNARRNFSACDAVAEAFTRAGHRTTYAAMASLCYDRTFADLRTLADTLYFAALRHVEKRR